MIVYAGIDCTNISDTKLYVKFYFPISKVLFLKYLLFLSIAFGAPFILHEPK